MAQPLKARLTPKIRRDMRKNILLVKNITDEGNDVVAL